MRHDYKRLTSGAPEKGNERRMAAAGDSRFGRLWKKKFLRLTVI
jgi:hypothetical protein